MKGVLGRLGQPVAHDRSRLNAFAREVAGSHATIQLGLLFQLIHPPTMINATPKQLRKAANIQEKIQSLQSELNSILLASKINSSHTAKNALESWRWQTETNEISRSDLPAGRNEKGIGSCALRVGTAGAESGSRGDY
jgi:hypothetical protein